VLTAAQSRLRINRALNLIILFIAKYIDVYCICRVVRGRLLDNGVKGDYKKKRTAYDAVWYQIIVLFLFLQPVQHILLSYNWDIK